MTTQTTQQLENRMKEINREMMRVDAKQARVLMNELIRIENKLGYTLDPLWR